MKRRILSILLSLSLLSSLLVFPAAAVGAAPSARSSNRAEHWFYDQLNSRARDIYNALWDMYDRGMMESGTESYDLAPLVGQPAIRDYLAGGRTLFDDFAAAKDAFDLEHPEAWYLDSSYLSFRVTEDRNGYHAWMGPGRAANYHLNGNAISGLSTKTAALESAVREIISGAESAGRAYSGENRTVRMVQYVHDQITQRISYRYEIDATRGNEDYIRTVYALVTHEGVCESYARSMQLILNRMGIPCVPVHGMQTSGDDPEPHMWNAVQISNKWYAVDATWDDPVRLDRQGNIKTTGTPGLDGGEIDNYLLVGQDVIGLNWQPSGVVSASGTEFTYPSIEQRSFNGDDVYQDAVGLHVSYSAAGVMEDEVAGKWTVDFRGDGVTEAAKDGFYFLVLRGGRPEGLPGKRVLQGHQDGGRAGERQLRLRRVRRHHPEARRL